MESVVDCRCPDTKFEDGVDFCKLEDPETGEKLTFWPPKLTEDCCRCSCCVGFCALENSEVDAGRCPNPKVEDGVGFCKPGAAFRVAG